jgi:asparagine synthase (glutamine-hydrolysing)
MADFALCRGRDAGALARRLLTRLERAGLSFAMLLEDEGSRLLWRCPGEPTQDAFWQQDADNWILRSGLFSHGGAAGAQALQSFFAAFDPAAPDLAGTRGQFTLVLRKAGRLCLLGDALGCNKIYCSDDGRLFSNLFIGVAEGLEAPRLDAQGCYEYVWNGVAGGERSFFCELKSLPPGEATIIADGSGPQQASLPALGLDEDEAEPGETMTAAAARQCERLQALTAVNRRAFGDRVNLLFSGGFDSRLLLALLLDAGMRPRLTVYGRPGDLDRQIAEQVARAEGLDFNPVDKSQVATPPAETFRDTLLADYAAFDGWRVTGLFDSGADRLDREAQVAGGRAKMNGSLGEIHRNFFYLPDRPFSARQLVQSFYARYDPRAMTERFDASAYENAIARAIMAAVGASESRLTRRQVELAYPLFRGRYWTAREVPLNQSFGLYLTPFMEPAVIKGTPDWEVAWKNHGLIEAAMIAHLSPRLAAHPSVYERPFDRPPSWSERLRAQASFRRPIWLRRLSYRMQQRRPAPRPAFLSPGHLASVMEPGFPYMRALFRPDSIADAEAFNRVATLEFLAQRYHARAL